MTGKQGQLARSLRERAAIDPDITLVCLGRPELDLSRPEGISQALACCNPDLIVNTAAYTEVDKAESDADAAFAVNADGAGAVARAAEQLGLPIIQISTDYVFDGLARAPYPETAPTNPLSVYGTSKLAGETLVAAANPRHLIIRTAWVYSPFGKNFVKTMLRLGLERDRISVVSDQIGNPTSALDIAETIIQVTRNLLADDDARLRGVFHMTGEGEASWAEFAQEIFSVWRKMNGRVAEVEPIPTSAYPTPAARPANSRLDCARLADVHRIRMPHWRESLDEVMRAF